MPPRKTGRTAPTATEPTNAAQWTHEGLYALPSGRAATLKRPGVLATASATGGRNVIADAALLQLNVAGPAPLSAEQRAETIRKNGQAYSACARLAFVYPRIVADGEAPDYAAGEISITDVEDEDLVWIYWEFIQGGPARAGMFRLK